MCAIFAFVANKGVKFLKNIGLSLRKRRFLRGGLASGKITTRELRAGGQMAKIFLSTSPSQYTFVILIDVYIYSERNRSISNQEQL
jgi:hypothetical protein